ncbi:PAS domain S-box-containing protein/diguanylate cyclase (GGDEF) domain-containing protein [Arsukibacterium tuosuense]|uniref:PAS domain S-box-containing protein/diguanylate cyclase (GGDEF) domain-containing protein n=1 Tax=Arsukibacterium tuosuense TaxID=1323745 RepID=A0A285JF76_9GAMM|nr:EAL domain-containing protein [Arsukibacterium tuosuense]SNY58950.1 PAS domain S-box-containing protein/diguanylate cyclase (GGDEF) domain-containing protein [Arsukibacterium tuosuense]
MRHLSYQYLTAASLREFITEQGLTSCQGVVQVFSGASLEQTTRLQLDLKRQLPQFVLIGASTAGEIYNGDCLEQAVILNFLIFEKTFRAQPFSLSLQPGQGLRNTIRTLFPAPPKVIIFFTNALETSPESLLKVLHQEMPACIFAGGNAADNASFTGTYTLLETEVYRKGLVGVALHSDTLQAMQHKFTGWHAIGQAFTVTAAANNVLYRLNDLPVLEVYKKYLGNDVVSGLPNTAMAFPFRVQHGEKIILRSPIGVTQDGSGIILAGDINIGDSVTFSFADIQLLMHEVKTLTALNQAALVIYSCAARKAYLGQHIHPEMHKLGANNHAAGGFFYGEYCSAGQQFDLLNLSTTLLVLSEQQLPPALPFADTDKQPIIPSSLYTLARLATATGKELNDALTFLRQHQHAVNQSSIVSITDADGIIVYVNKKFEDISGYSAPELIGNTHQLIKHPAMPAKVYQNLWQTINSKRTWQGLILNRKKDGSHYYVKTVIVPILDEHQNISRFLSIRNDVTDIVKARQTIRIQNTDALTGLPNRTRLSTDLKNSNIVLLAVFDTRNFKLLNDYWGIEQGDKAIRQLAQHFVSAASSLQLQTYKFHGASFALRPLSQMSLQQFSAKCEQLRTEVEAATLDFNDHVFDINLSIGIGVSGTRAIALAESALAEAKTYYSTSLVIKTEQQIAGDNAYHYIEQVREALNDKRLTAWFQRLAPVNRTSQDCDKFEALVRIDQGNGEVTAPGVFLDYIKKTRLYGALTREVVAIAVATANRFKCKVSVNISIQDILDSQTTEFIFSNLQGHNGQQIIFEITESEAIREFSSVAEFIRKVRSYGAQIAIDDFGSGYSNFAYLVDIKPEFIKIDGSIIKGVVDNKNSRLVTKSIIDMAKNLGIKTIAEFVSTADIYQCLKQLGVDMVQGYYISKPIPASDITRNQQAYPDAMT